MFVRAIDQLVDQSGDVVTGRNARDRPGKDVVEHQRRDTDLGKGGSQRFLYVAVDAAAREHGAALHVHHAHRHRKTHHAQDEPGRGFSHCLFGDADGVKRRRTQVVEDDGRRPPEGDESEHHRTGYDDSYSVRRTWRDCL